ncbi:DUF1330 domain-containing protein [Catenovulum sp. SM1970]|uniref:DUF1330 domain-containing protein n=1 Tax=Marinifaba aquimaris TaxID=2741323 RepID=UPI0015745C06|nr:DUF1330 domain-containing protein [Marinifaba aquimaris]NTS75608.1 DUF1330 domain-containing protein [Marinifaba aquimaris]
MKLIRKIASASLLLSSIVCYAAEQPASLYLQFNTAEQTNAPAPALSAKVINTLFGDEVSEVSFYQTEKVTQFHNTNAIRVDLNQPFEFKPKGDKFYTLAQVWLADNQDYARYLKATDSLREKLGARVLLKLKPAKLAQSEPDYLVLVEWQQAENIALYAQHEEFLPHQPLFESGTTRFNWYQVAFN